MSILTQGLASLALVRAGWPRAPRKFWIVAVAAGAIADADLTSAWFGPAAWLQWHHRYTHSLLVALLLAAGFAVSYRLTAKHSLRDKFSATNAFALIFAAELLHLLLDVCGWEGVALSWPFSSRLFAMDWAANLDPFMVAVLLSALLVPELLHLVTTEIGARDQRPRGRIGARIGFAIILFYLGMRANFHSNVLALMDARTFRGEVAERVGAFPEPLSPLTWHGIVESQSALHTLTVITGPVGSFDPETAETLFKPQPSPALDRAGKTASAQSFLQTARFPKASLEKTATGTLVELRDLRYQAAGARNHEVLAVIHLDADNRVVAQELVWATQ
jgi:membrane-bound metal-dependent hydrolase YbcI (DUF457 family)